jgi:hypothetical protein
MRSCGFFRRPWMVFPRWWRSHIFEQTQQVTKRITVPIPFEGLSIEANLRLDDHIS